MNKDDTAMKLNENIGYLINRTGLRMKLAVQRAFREHGYQLTSDHWGILQKLYECDSLPQIELARLLGKDQPNITRIIDGMEKKNLAKRIPAPDDRRKYLITLTPYGKSIREDIFAIAKQVRDKAYQGLSTSELNTLGQLINRIYLNLE